MHYEEKIRMDNMRLFSALSWAVGALEARGVDAGTARRELDNFLEMVMVESQDIHVTTFEDLLHPD